MRRVWISLLAAILFLLPGPARAANFVVDPDGGGDFTTIQGALDDPGVVR